MRDSRFARTSLIAGVCAVILAPFVIGGIPAAIGMHAGVSHLRFRAGSRAVAFMGIAFSALGGVLSAAAAIVLASMLMMIRLQPSALEQARSWEGKAAGQWTLTDRSGAAHTSDALRGTIVFLDCFSTKGIHSPSATKALAAFAARTPSVHAISWGSQANEQAAAQFVASTATEHPVAIGEQAMPEPFSQVSAKPTLFVIDGNGVIRTVLLGTYTEADLQLLLKAAATPLPP